ncbi:hypothetical protein NQ315_017153 [Exocentrus adspersus]|uniref:Integrase catalytic domain-containing protein n=1 Tax=Exocentrus adspersus TaxID=1586481 RepID=A0AAV8VBT7_9CUCU|nr:hypothetical protein NQ315_017153 [Exocentrus adspersus]
MKTHSKEKIQLVNELHKAARKIYSRHRTIIKGLDDLWQMDLADITKNYNGTVHSTIGCKPQHVNKSNEADILKSSYSHIKMTGKRKFKIGHIVPISKT